jgi:hypothetical protein
MVSLGRLGMQAGLRLVSKVAGLWLAVFAVTAVIPHAPVLLPSNFDARKWEILSPLHAEEGGALSRGEIAQIQKAQSSLLQREFAGLAAFRFDVFQALSQIPERAGSGGRSVRP